MEKKYPSDLTNKEQKIIESQVYKKLDKPVIFIVILTHIMS